MSVSVYHVSITHTAGRVRRRSHNMFHDMFHNPCWWDLRCRTMSGQWTVEITSVTWLVVNRSCSESMPLILRRKSNTLIVCMSVCLLVIYQMASWTCFPVFHSCLAFWSFHTISFAFLLLFSLFLLSLSLCPTTVMFNTLKQSINQ